jgi:hypothetical protein
MTNRKKKYLLVIAIIALASALFILKYTFRKSETSVAGKQTQIEVTVSEILQTFESNEKLGDSLYLDKIIIVSGKVESVSEDSTGVTIYLKEDDAVSGVLCSFSKDVINVSNVAKGERLKIKGICTGFLMDVVMNRCVIENDNKE